MGPRRDTVMGQSHRLDLTNAEAPHAPFSSPQAFEKRAIHPLLGKMARFGLHVPRQKFPASGGTVALLTNPQRPACMIGRVGRHRAKRWPGPYRRIFAASKTG